MTGNCSGAHEPDTVRPLDQCKTCAHWLSTTGERVYPLIQIKPDGDGVTVLCGRRQAVKAEG